MREQRSGQRRLISAMAGTVGRSLARAFGASKFGLEGWTESPRFQVEPFGIHTTIVEPGFFRTERLTQRVHPDAVLLDRRPAERTAADRPAWQAMSGKQSNDPEVGQAPPDPENTVFDFELPPARSHASTRSTPANGGPDRGGDRTATCRRSSTTDAAVVGAGTRRAVLEPKAR